MSDILVIGFSSFFFVFFFLATINEVQYFNEIFCYCFQLVFGMLLLDLSTDFSLGNLVIGKRDRPFC